VTWVAALFIVVAFLVLAWVLRVQAHAAEVMQRSRRAVAAMRDASLSEREKERSMREQARRLFVLFVILTASGVIALLVPIGLLAALEAMGLLDLGKVMETALSWEFLVVVSLIGIVWFFLIRSRRR
jgi:hypothetical protein